MKIKNTCWSGTMSMQEFSLTKWTHGFVPFFFLFFYFQYEWLSHLLWLPLFFVDHKPLAVPFGTVYSWWFWTPLKGLCTSFTIWGPFAEMIVSGNWLTSSHSDSLKNWYTMVSSVVRYIICRNAYFPNVLGNLWNVHSVTYLWHKLLKDLAN